MPVYTKAIVDDLQFNSERIAEAASRVVRTEFPNIPVESRVVMGKPGNEIVNDARQWGSDLIIVGSHGHGFWKRALLGSVSDAVVHRAPCSVLVVRPPMSRSN
jgi:nucleotide-binding universal stress UspA family protein